MANYHTLRVQKQTPNPHVLADSLGMQTGIRLLFTTRRIRGGTERNGARRDGRDGPDGRASVTNQIIQKHNLTEHLPKLKLKTCDLNVVYRLFLTTRAQTLPIELL